ncbi:MAG: hypothetical protein Q9182_004401 [Xanthomendoza sp. 2 TL-2023]
MPHAPTPDDSAAAILANAAPIATATANVAMMAAAPLPPRHVVSMEIAATTTPNAAKKVARPKTQTAVASVITVTEFTNGSGGSSGSGNSGGKAAPRPVSPSSFSIPDISISSFNPADYPSLPPATIPSLPPVPTYGGSGTAAAVTSFSLPTLTAQSTTPGAVLQTFTTTITIRYYTIFITTTTFIRTETVFLTTSLTYTRQEITALATDRPAANRIFNTIALSASDAPTQSVSANGVRDFSQTRSTGGTRTTVGTSFATGTGAGVAGSAMSAGERAMGSVARYLIK